MLPPQPGRPAGRHFGRVVHDISATGGRVEDVPAQTRIRGQRHGVPGADCEAAAFVARRALERIAELVPKARGGPERRPCWYGSQTESSCDGRIDFAWSDGLRWTVVDYKQTRRKRRRVGQVQLYALALQQAAGLSARGIVLEV